MAKTPKGVVTAWNAGAERLYGYTAQEAIGADVAELIIPPERGGRER
ncbi:MAG: PAS domain-containing protein [Thermoleophilaceae bacterium]